MLRETVGVPLSTNLAQMAWTSVLEHRNRVPHQLIRQEGDYLCWAACAAMVDAAQPNPLAVSQCEIVAAFLETECCDAATTSKKCDVPIDQADITRVLQHYCPGANAILAFLDEDELDFEVFENQRMVQIRWRWSGAGAIDAHVVLVVGGILEPGMTTIYTVHDPMYSAARSMTYEQLLEAEGKGYWADSWTGL